MEYDRNSRLWALNVKLQCMGLVTLNINLRSLKMICVISGWKIFRLFWTHRKFRQSWTWFENLAKKLPENFRKENMPERKHAGKMPEKSLQWKTIDRLINCRSGRTFWICYCQTIRYHQTLKRNVWKTVLIKNHKKQLIRIRGQINRFNYQFSPFLDLQTGWIQNNAIYTARGIKASIIRCCDEGYFSHFIAFGCWRKIISRLIICPINFKKGFDIRTLGGW